MFRRSPTQRKDDNWEVFVSYAHEDRRYARSLVKELDARRVKVWFDESSMELGQSLVDAVSKGLVESQFVVAVLSKAYFAKPWPKAELRMLVQKELHSGGSYLLPIWHNLDASEVFEHFPMIADRFAVRSSDGLDKVAYYIMKRLRPPDTYPMFSARLSHYLGEIELQTGKAIHLIEVGKAPPDARMPGTALPPFSVDPDFRHAINLYYSQYLSSDDTEAAIAGLLTSIALLFAGYPQARLSPIKAMVSGTGCALGLNEVDAIQKWLHQALFSLQSERMILQRGFTRNATLTELIDGMASGAQIPLSRAAREIINAIDLAMLTCSCKYGIIPERLRDYVDRILTLLAGYSPLTVQYGQRIADRILQTQQMTAAEFAACFTAILDMWGLGTFVELGYLDRKTGNFVGERPSLAQIYKMLKRAEE